MRGVPGLKSYGPCSTWLRNYARSLGHSPGRGRWLGYGKGYEFQCIQCGLNIKMVNSKVGTGFRHVGVIPECSNLNDFSYGWGI